MEMVDLSKKSYPILLLWEGYLEIKVFLDFFGAILYLLAEKFRRFY